MIYFTAHTFKCVCHCRRAMFRVLGMYNFDRIVNTYCHFFPAGAHQFYANIQLTLVHTIAILIYLY